MNKLRAMQGFVQVVQANSFSGAAVQLGRSRARLSQSVSALEAELGVRLLQRTTRSLKLTEVGRDYYRRATELLAELQAMEDDATSEARALEGILRVTAPPGFAGEFLSTLTSDFHAMHPAVRVHLNLTHRMVELVEEGIDVAIRISEPEDSSLIARKIAPVPLALVASPSYLEARGRPRTPKALLRHDCLVDSNFRGRERWPFSGRSGTFVVAVSGPFQVNSPTAVRDLAVEGHGIALTPRFVAAKDIADGRLIEVLKGRIALAWSLYAVYPQRRYLPRRVRAYIDHLVASCGAGALEPT